MRSGRWDTILCGVLLRIRVFSVLAMPLVMAAAILPQSLVAQRQPGVSDATLTLSAGDEGTIDIQGTSLAFFARAEAFSVRSGDSARNHSHAREGSRSLPSADH